MAADLVRAVGKKLRRPLLVGPGPARSDDCECIVVRQAVLGDLPARDEREEAVVDEQARREDGEEDDGETHEEDHEDDLLLGDPE